MLARLGWTTDASLGIMLVNLVNDNPFFDWFVRNLDIGILYPKKQIDIILSEFMTGKHGRINVINDYNRICLTPLGTKLNFGYVDGDNMARTTCNVSDPRVILYALYKFAEKCGDHKEFTLNELLSDNIDRDGISPTRIFGLDREAMQPILLGLDANYHDFITATFTNDLNKISLRDDKTSADVLELFKEGNGNG
jgi:phosphoadenosine phosphosulfate reductase